jgi:hypothetical protein
VDVSQGELAEICSEPDIDCTATGMPTGSGGASGSGQIGGVSGSSGSGTSGSFGSGGTPTTSTGGTTGASGSSGTSGNSGSSGSSGASGSAGSSGTVLQPLAKGMCMSASSVVIIYTDRGSDQQASMTLKVQNDGQAFDLTDLTIRYWFTDDGLGAFTSEIDYAQVNGVQGFSKSDVTVTFGTESGSNYAQIGFTAGGSIAQGGGVDQVQLRFHTSDYKKIDQTNDFSYQGSAAAAPNANITPYVNGTQVGGCVPLPP